jgi:hypothetical protein
MADFWVYENRRATGDQSRVHIASCRYCNAGKGVVGARASNGTWHGPFVDFLAASNVSLALPGLTHHCRVCRPAG